MAGRYEPHLQHASSLPPLSAYKLGDTTFLATIHLKKQDEGKDLHLTSSAWNLLALSRCGLIAESSQQVDGKNLGERSSFTLGDFMLRMNHLLKHSLDEQYGLNDDNSTGYIYASLVKVLQACGLTQRLLPQQHCKHSDVEAAVSREQWLQICNTSLHGLSGGEQQRLRLASIFFVEKVKFDSYCKAVQHKVCPHPLKNCRCVVLIFCYICFVVLYIGLW